MRGFYRYENLYAMQYDIYQILYFNITEMCLISGINSTTCDLKKKPGVRRKLTKQQNTMNTGTCIIKV